MRLDLACIKRGLVDSRNKACEMIQKGLVKCNGEVCLKAAYEVSDEDKITLEGKIFISRAGEKLWCFLEEYFCDFYDKSVLDIGSSTGGFTQVLLERGAKEVYCVDVGRGQLHNTLRENPKVFCFEGMDIRDFPLEFEKITARKNTRFDWVLCDVSFIPLEKVLPTISLLAYDKILLLFKPQYEVGKEARRNKKGVVLQKDKINAALSSFLERLKAYHFEIQNLKTSKIKGKEGNVEFFIACQKTRNS